MGTSVKILLIFTLLPMFSVASLLESQSLLNNKKWYEASGKLLMLSDDKLSEKDQGLKYFALGIAASNMQKRKDSEHYFKLSLNRSSNLKNHINFELAKIYLVDGELDKAKANLEEIKKMRSPRNIQNQAHFMLSDIYMKKKYWNSAYKNLYRLERRWRGEEGHADVIWRLIQVEIKRKRKWRACRWARKLYSKYPAHPIVYDWGIDLSRNKVQGKSLGCLASESDIAERMRRWQWAGEVDRARMELDDLKKRMQEKSPLEVDKLMAKHLIQQGYAGEAVETLLPHYESNSKNFDYLMNLGKASSRSGEYQTAVGAYYQAHKLKPRGRNGRKALFRAAFLSYQFQDYDGATRKFQNFTKLYKKSGLSRDAKWHLAWIRYLKGDYRGALTSFSKILKLKKRYKRKWSKFPEEKIRYWQAMSHYRLEEFVKAKNIFEEISKDKLMSFYAYASKSRMAGIPQEVLSLSKAQDNDLKGVKRLPSSAFVEKAELKQKKETIAESDESEENLDTEDDDYQVGEEEFDFPPEIEEKPVAFKDPKLKENFERAQDFVRIGLFDRARWEYYEVERRTTNKDYLLLLMRAYEEIHSYHRSAYIGQVFFVTPRERYEMKNVRYLWEHTYPQAFNKHVVKYGENYNVPKPYIWSIMRAESRYRPFVVSPVGAKGLMQIMPKTGRQISMLLGLRSFQARNLKEPEMNIRLGSRYLMRLLKKFNGSLPLSTASYNAGPHRVETWLASFGTLQMDEFIEHIPFVETRNYVKKVIRFYGVYNKLYFNNSTPLAWLSKDIPIVQTRKPAQRESWEKL